MHVFNLVHQLHKEYDFTGVFGEEGTIAQRLRDLGVLVHILPEMRSSISPIRDVRSCLALRKIIRDIQPDLIHAHSSKAGMIARFTSILTGVPTIYTVHGWGWRGMGKIKRSLLISVEKILLHISRKSSFIYVAEAVEEEGRKILGIQSTAGSVVYNGVPDTGFALPKSNDPQIILMAARLDHAKDHITLIKAFDKLAFSAELWLCGQGTDSAEFSNSISTIAPNNHDKIRTLGVITNMSQLLQSVHVYALISHFEALPLSIIEAMANGNAIIATDVGGVSELIDSGQTGLLVPPKDVEKLAQGLESLRNVAYRTKLAEGARARFERKFQACIMSQAVSDVYQSKIKLGL